jgi:hypothetical protein
MYPFGRKVFCLVLLLLSVQPAHAGVWSSAPEPVRAVSRWGAAGLAAGALSGVVVAPIAGSARPVFLGASVGLYLGLAVGLYKEWELANPEPGIPESEPPQNTGGAQTFVPAPPIYISWKFKF